MRRYYVYMFIFLGLSLIIMGTVNNRFETEFVFSNYNDFIVKGDTIIDCGKSSGNIVIPKMIDGVEIKRIGDYACDGLNIDNVYLPSTIVSIGNYAFSNNNINSLNIPNNVKEIGEGAFIHNNITTLKFDSSLVIGNASFNDNKLDFDEAFFYRDDKLVSYGGHIKGNVILPNVSVIGEKAFYESYIVSISIPNTVTKIEDEAFKNNFLIELYIPNNIGMISETAFSSNSYLSSIIVDNNSSNLDNYPWGAVNSSLYWLK